MKTRLSTSLCLAALVALLGFRATAADKKSAPVKKVYPTFGSVERLDPELDKLLPADAKLELLAEGFTWTEGPVWSRKGGYLLFCDIPRNVIFKWKDGEGTSEFLSPSGYTGSTPRGGEPGSNGLTMDPGGHLLMCEHGDRRVTRLESNGQKTTLAEYYKDRRLNSPNDLVLRSNGDLYFTDPPYGLEGNNADPKKELMFNGVYRRSRFGELTLLIKDLTFPNGIAFSPDEKTLYVAVSDAKRMIWMAYDVKNDGSIANGRVFYDITSQAAGKKGGPDGMKVDLAGNLWATGPGGIVIFTPQAKILGVINTGEPTANCAWGEDGSVLYITANNKICRIKTTTKGKMP